MCLFWCLFIQYLEQVEFNNIMQTLGSGVSILQIALFAGLAGTKQFTKKWRDCFHIGINQAATIHQLWNWTSVRKGQKRASLLSPVNSQIKLSLSALLSINIEDQLDKILDLHWLSWLLSNTSSQPILSVVKKTQNFGWKTSRRLSGTFFSFF